MTPEDSVTIDVAAPGRDAPLRITGSASDFGVMGAVARGGGAYEPGPMTFMAHTIEPGWQCLDIGANIGILASAMAQACMPGKTVAFEPAKSAYSYLCANLEANAAANATALRIGIYSDSGSMDLSHAQGHPGGAHLSAEGRVADDNLEQVPVVALDTWIEENGFGPVNFVKIDVEGSEMHVLDGGRATFATRPVLLIECNPLALKRFHGASAVDLYSRLQVIYGEVGHLAGDGLPVKISSPAELVDLLERQGILDLVAGVELHDRRTIKTRIMSPVVRLASYLAHRPAAVKVSRRFGVTRFPRSRFVLEPRYAITFSVNRLVVSVSSLVTVPVTITNTSTGWYSSSFPNHPVCVSYHWARDGEVIELDGIRTFLPEPLGPGQTVELPLTVAVPDGAGEYELQVALVQESFAWFDQIDDRLAFCLPCQVRSPAS